MTRWRARALQLIGILTATIGLAGFWLTIGSTRTVLSEVDLALTNPTGEPFQASFVVAGRDIDWAIPARNPIYNSRGEITGFRTPARGKSYSGRTDSIFYVHVVGDTLHLIAIPRDIWLDHKGMRINAVMGRAGADGLRQAVSDLLGLPVDYHVIVNIEIFQRVIDALGGVTIEVPRRMYYADTAASLLIDLHPGVQHMDGADVANFVRFRSGGGDDLGRIDNLKRLASALLQRLRSLNVRLLTVLPDLVDTYLDEVETNIDPGSLAQLMRRAPNLTIATAATLPTFERTHPAYTQGTDLEEVERFLASAFGGQARSISTLPEATLLISNATGMSELGEHYRTLLAAHGIPKDRISLRELATPQQVSRIQVTNTHWLTAAYFAHLLHVERRQVYQLDSFEGSRRDIELVLGEDAFTTATAKPFLADMKAGATTLSLSPGETAQQEMGD